MKSIEFRDEAVSQQPPYPFDIFLSYSRKDRKFAARLENALESYRFPKSLKTSKRNLNVFRDESDIQAGENYDRIIEHHLKGSAKLIVVCSPDARRSKYVDDEIRRFLATHAEYDIIPVLVRGKANNETTDENENAFPDRLCENRMPLAANFLGWDTYKGKLNKGPFSSSFYQILSGINGTDRRKLEQIDEKSRARRRIVILSTAAVIILVLSVALVNAVVAQRRATRSAEAERNERLRADAAAASEKKERLRADASAEEEKKARVRADASAEAEKKARIQADLSAEAERKAREKAVAASLAEKKAKNEAIAQKNTAERLLYASNIVLATQAYNSGNTERTRALLDSPAVDAGQENPRGFEWYYLSSLFNRKLASFTAHKSVVTSIAFSPDGKILVTGSDRMFKLWDAATQKYLGSLGDPDGDKSNRDTAVAFSPDGKLIATVTDTGFQLWDAASRKLLATPETGESFGKGLGANWSFHVGDNAQTVAFSPDGKMVAACLLGICQLWDVASVKLLTPPRDSLTSPDGTPAFFTRSFERPFAFSPDSSTLAFSADKLKIWDIKSQTTIQTLDANSISSIGFLPDGKLFASGGYYNKLLIFERDANTKQYTPLPPFNISDRTSKVLFSPDGQTFVTATDSELAYGGNVQLWDANSRKLLATFEGLGTQGSVSALAFSPDGHILAIGSNTSLQLSDARAKRSIEGAGTAVHSPPRIFQLKSSPDNTKFAALVSADVGYAVKLWDSNLTLLATFDVGLSDLLAFSNDGKTLATGSKQSGVSLRDISHVPYTEFELPLNRPCHSEEFYDYSESAAFKRGDKTLAIGSHYCLQWWDIANKRYLPAPAQYQQGYHLYSPVAYSPDGKLFAARVMGNVIIIDGDSRQTLTVINYSSALTPTSLVFSADSKRLVVGTMVGPISNRPVMKTGGTLDIWDVSTLNYARKKEAQKWDRTSPFPLLATLEGHTDEITDVAISPDGKTLASSSLDKTVKLWSQSTNQLLLTLVAGDSPVTTLAYSGDNQMLLGGDTKGGVKLWRAPRDGEKTARNPVSPGHP